MARALLKRNRLLLLDEATASVDYGKPCLLAARSRARLTVAGRHRDRRAHHAFDPRGVRRLDAPGHRAYAFSTRPCSPHIHRLFTRPSSHRDWVRPHPGARRGPDHRVRPPGEAAREPRLALLRSLPRDGQERVQDCESLLTLVVSSFGADLISAQEDGGGQDSRHAQT